MRLLVRLTALAVCAVLLAAPAARACVESGEMSPRCPMAAAPTGMSMCHGAGEMPRDCCDLERTPEPIEASAFESPRLTQSPHAAPLPAAARLVPVERSPCRPSTVTLHGRDPGLFTLHASLLL